LCTVLLLYNFAQFYSLRIVFCSAFLRNKDRLIRLANCDVSWREFAANIVRFQLLRSYEMADGWGNWMLANIDWYLLPIVNPDGYEYSMTTVGVQNLVVEVFTSFLTS